MRATSKLASVVPTATATFTLPVKYVTSAKNVVIYIYRLSRLITNSLATLLKIYTINECLGFLFKTSTREIGNCGSPDQPTYLIRFNFRILSRLELHRIIVVKTILTYKQ